MYTALCIMLVAIIIGRLFRRFLSEKLLHYCLMASIFLLLFLLGVSIGGNESLIQRLPEIGWNAILLMLCCVAGSIICVLPLKRLKFFKSLWNDKQ